MGVSASCDMNCKICGYRSFKTQSFIVGHTYKCPACEKIGIWIGFGLGELPWNHPPDSLSKLEISLWKAAYEEVSLLSDIYE